MPSIYADKSPIKHYRLHSRINLPLEVNVLLLGQDKSVKMTHGSVSRSLHHRAGRHDLKLQASLLDCVHTDACYN